MITARNHEGENVTATNDSKNSSNELTDLAERFPSLERARGVVVVDGIGIRLNVRNGELRISDGVGRFRRERSFSRVDPPKRVVVVGRAGAISLESLGWLHSVNAGFLHLDRDGDIVAASVPDGRNDVRIRRAQALAAESPTGVEVARYLLALKIEGQLQVSKSLTTDSEPLHVLQQGIQAVQTASDLASLRQVEAATAAAYWSCWGGLEPRFVTKDRSRIPAHWRRFSARRSLVSGTPRAASDPVNAALNLLYAVAEVECRFACIAVGVDPALGIIHKDAPNRASFSLDLLEAIRPDIDAYVLHLISRPLRLRDFRESRDGVCRVLPPLSHHLSATMPAWATQLAPVAEQVAAMFAKESETKIARLSTPLTQRNRKKAKGSEARSIRAPRYLPPSACQMCGQILHAGQTICSECLPELKHQQVAAMSERSRAKLSGVRRTAASKAKQSNTMRVRNQQVAEWNRKHPGPVDSRVFVNEILPGLQGVSVRAIARATGLSSLYASQIRRGRVPNGRHWLALEVLAQCYSGMPSD